MHVRANLALLILPLWLLCTGCSSLQKPTAALRSASIADVTPDGLRLNFDVDVTNPNAVAIPLSGARYDLSLGRSKVLSGDVDSDITIPANGTDALTVPVNVTFEQLLAAEDVIRSSGGDIPYAFGGTLNFTANSGLPIPLKVPFQYKGELPLRKMLSDPAVLLQSPQARRLAQRVLGGMFGL